MAAGRKRQPNRAGTISRRPDGRYEAKVWARTTSGVLKRVSVYGRTWDECHARYVELLEKARRNVPVPDRPWKVGEYLDYWLENVARPTVRPTTYAKYDQNIRLYLKPSLGPHKLERLSVSAVQGFLNERLRGGDSVAKVQAMRTTLSAALTRAMREELVFRNVARLATLPPSEPRRLRPWSPVEARQFLTAARRDPLYPAFVLLLVYGMRRGEVCGLSWDDVDLDAKQMRVQWQHYRAGGQLVRGPVKTRAGRRTLPVLPMVARVLEDHGEHQMRKREAASSSWHETGLVFTTRTGWPVEPRNLARSFERISEQAGLRPIRLHDLRHTCASLLKQLGVSPRDAMEILGHSRISVTMEIYTHADGEVHRDALDKLGNLFDDQEQE